MHFWRIDVTPISELGGIAPKKDPEFFEGSEEQFVCSRKKAPALFEPSIAR
jgi:hypothetical protein